MTNEKQDFVDRLLEASIAHGASQEPRVGLEGRILAGVAARQRKTRGLTWALGLAASALAVVAIGVTARLTRHSPWSPSQPSDVTVTRPQPVAKVAPIAPKRIPAKTVRVSRAAAQRPQQFPTPAPLSEQEKLLLLYVKETPESILAAPPKDATKDLEIPALNIAALQVKDLPREHDTE